MKKLLIATHNEGKIGEYKKFLKGLSIELVSLSSVGITEDVRALGAVLPPLVCALGREDLHEAVEVLERRRLQDHVASPRCSPRRRSTRWCGEYASEGHPPHRENALSEARGGPGGARRRPPSRGEPARARYAGSVM